MCLFDKLGWGSDTDRSKNSHALGARRPGHFAICGAGDGVRPTRGDGFLPTKEAAALVGVSPSTLRDWRAKGYLKSQGLDERGHPLHTAEAVRAAEELARQAGLKASGVDPRRLRRAAFPAPALA